MRVPTLQMTSYGMGATVKDQPYTNRKVIYDKPNLKIVILENQAGVVEYRFETQPGDESAQIWPGGSVGYICFSGKVAASQVASRARRKVSQIYSDKVITILKLGTTWTSCDFIINLTPPRK